MVKLLTGVLLKSHEKAYGNGVPHIFMSGVTGFFDTTTLDKTMSGRRHVTVRRVVRP